MLRKKYFLTTKFQLSSSVGDRPVRKQFEI